MPKLFPIGISDFRDMRESGLHYVDKSMLIKEILEERGTRVFLFPRPRRFGKTLNLTMLRCWFEKRSEDYSHLFEGLGIWQAGDTYRDHFQRYPIVYLTFKDLKPERKKDWQDGVRLLLQDLFLAHTALLDDPDFPGADRKRFILLMNGDASLALQQRSLLLLTSWLSRRYREKVIILVDEYDTPIHAAHLGNFSGPVLSFFRNFLGGGLKDHPDVFKAVLTGILRVAKENIFSGINNLEVYGLLRLPFSDCFGFTEQEVSDLLEKTGLQFWGESLRAWYNGYLFGDRVIFNPWSVMNFLKDDEHTLSAWWLNTSANDLIREQLMRHGLEVEQDIRTLLDGGSIVKSINDNVVLSKLDQDPRTFWSLMLFSGYLRGVRLAAATPLDEQSECCLSIPNREVRKIYVETFREWMELRLPGFGEGVRRLLEALFRGDARRLEQQLGRFVLNVLSFHDKARDYPEAVPHGFVLGLCATLEPHYRVRFNRESGLGHPDVLVVPIGAGRPGVAMELKVAEDGVKTLDQALQEARTQIRSKRYTAELVAIGADPIQCYAIAFMGKVVKVEKVDPESSPLPE